MLGVGTVSVPCPRCPSVKRELEESMARERAAQHLLAEHVAQREQANIAREKLQADLIKEQTSHAKLQARIDELVALLTEKDKMIEQLTLRIQTLEADNKRLAAGFGRLRCDLAVRLLYTTVEQTIGFLVTRDPGDSMQVAKLPNKVLLSVLDKINQTGTPDALFNNAADLLAFLERSRYVFTSDGNACAHPKDTTLAEMEAYVQNDEAADTLFDVYLNSRALLASISDPTAQAAVSDSAFSTPNSVHRELLAKEAAAKALRKHPRVPRPLSADAAASGSPGGPPAAH